jgi:peptidoglycan/xylan/chitin deacetylase (PgdA/CDA1 family)
MRLVASAVGGCLLLSFAACSANPSSSTAVTSASVAPKTTTVVSTSSASTTEVTTAPTTTVPTPQSTTTAVTSTTVTTVPPTTTTSIAAVTVATRIAKGTNGRAVVALTFDAGADTGNAARILDILASNHVRASFGVTGRWAELNPELFRRMAADHQIINHTYDHRSWTGLSTKTPPLTDQERLAEIVRADDVYKRLAGISPAPFFRAPFGDLDKAADRLIAAAGYSYDVLYTTDSRGWQGVDPAAIARNCRAGDVAGDIIVMHVGSRSRDVEALQQVIDDIRAAGLTPGPVTDIISTSQLP